MMTKHYIGLKLHRKLHFEPSLPEIKIELPDGCVGIMFVFKNKKTGKAFLGNDTTFEEVFPKTELEKGE